MTELDPGAAAPDAPWRRLDARMLAVFPIKQVGALIPVAAVVLITGRDGGEWQLFGAVAGPVALVALGVLRWLTVRYRVGAERVELRSGLLNRQQRSVRRDRVRTVDLTAGPVHRVFGLSVVEIGTGSGTSGEGRLSLDAVTATEAERLRRDLLDRSPVAIPTDSASATGAANEPTGQLVVARLRPSWLRFAPLTTSGLVAVGAVIGTFFQFADTLGFGLDTLLRAGDRLAGVPVWLSASALVATVLLVGGLGSLAIYVEGWWGYRLTREPDGTLRLRRGLLTTRSLSIEQQRMRGVEVTESLPLRLFRGARCAAVTTGLDAKSSSGGALLPPAPRAEAHRVAAQALLLDDPAAATASALRRHPPAALRRRLTRAVTPAAILVTGAWWLRDDVSWAGVLWPAALVLLPLAVLLGVDRYRNLGHALRPEYLVIGQGSVLRRTVALQRRGIIGWRLRQSLFQRRAGLVTLHAVTAAGTGYYPVVDLPMARAVELVNQVNPGLLPGVAAVRTVVGHDRFDLTDVGDGRGAVDAGEPGQH